MKLRPLVFVAPLLVLPLLLTGCATSYDPLLANPGPASLGQISGSVFGGRQPVSGAHLYVLAVGTGGYGGNGIAASTGNASTSLLSSSSVSGYPTAQDGNGRYYVTTGASGDFIITGEYTCTQNTQVYLYAVGGNPGAGVNSASGFMAVLGNCPSGGTLATQSPTVYVNEVSTIAAAYALAGFATDPLHISSANTALAKTGVANAAANAGQMYSVTNPVNKTFATGAGALQTTPNSGTNGGTGTVPYMEINTLANILASCVNTNGPTSTNCTTLFRNATSDGVTCATTCADEATDTAAAAINIAHYPVTSVSTLYGLVGATAVPFTPALTAAPNNWTVQLLFTGGGIKQATTGSDTLAIDGSGNVWAISYYGSALSKFSPLGVPVSSTGYTNALINGMNGMSFDAASAHLYIANFNSATILNFNVSSTSFSSFGSQPAVAGAGPLDVQVDGGGNLWVANLDPNESNTGSNVVKMSTSGTNIKTIGSNISSNTGPIGVDSLAMEAGSAGNTWMANTGNNGVLLYNNAGTLVTSSTGGGVAQAWSTAIDASGNAWFTSAFNNVISKFGPTGGSPTSFAVPASIGNSPVINGLAMDGASNVWVTSNNVDGSDTNADNLILEYNNAGTLLSGTTGFAPSPASILPSAVVIDGSGNVWYNSSNSQASASAVAGALYEIVGAAVPVATPISYAVVNSLLGSRP